MQNSCLKVLPICVKFSKYDFIFKLTFMGKKEVGGEPFFVWKKSYATGSQAWLIFKVTFDDFGFDLPIFLRWLTL